MDKIFLDNASTTKIDERVNDLIYKVNKDDYFNPSANYHESLTIHNKIINAQKTIASILNVDFNSIIFTSGATESNNLAIFGSITGKKNAEYLFSSVEHPSVYNVAKELENRGQIVRFINTLSNGKIDIEHLKSLLNENTHFVSVVFVNNETGAINDIEKIGKIIKEYNKSIIFHVDGVQAFTKLDCDLKKLKVDAFSISAHKFHGPKGVGALYYKDMNKLKPIFFGGGQQNNYRSGTENISGILGLELASILAQKNIIENYEYVSGLKKMFFEKISDELKDYPYEINGDESCSPYILSISFSGLKSEVLMHILETNGVLVGTGSACSSKKQGNRILSSMNKLSDYIKGNIRISFSNYSTKEEVKKASEIFVKSVKELYEKIRGK